MDNNWQVTPNENSPNRKAVNFPLHFPKLYRERFLIIYSWLNNTRCVGLHFHNSHSVDMLNVKLRAVFVSLTFPVSTFAILNWSLFYFSFSKTHILGKRHEDRNSASVQSTFIFFMHIDCCLVCTSTISDIVWRVKKRGGVSLRSNSPSPLHSCLFLTDCSPVLVSLSLLFQNSHSMRFTSSLSQRSSKSNSALQFSL